MVSIDGKAARRRSLGNQVTKVHTAPGGPWAGRWEVLRAWERGSPFSDLVPSKGQRPPVSPSKKPTKTLCDCRDRHNVLEMFLRQWNRGAPWH